MPSVSSTPGVALRTGGHSSSFADEPAAPETVSTTTSTSSLPTTTTAKLATRAATPRAKAPTLAKSGDYGPESPGTVHFPYQEGRTQWETTSNGVSLKLTMSTASVKTGEAVSFDMEISQPGTPCCSMQLLFGDGFQYMAHNQATCPGGTYGPGTVLEHTSHVWNKPAYWTLMFDGAPGGCDTQSTNPGTMKVTIYVGPGATTSQGPTAPKLKVDEYGDGHPPPPNTFKVFAEADDEDGWLRRFALDWGDGSAVETYPASMGCTTTPGGWPAKTNAWLPSEPPPTHTYTYPGTHAITVTVFSTGCDGTDEQHTSAPLSYTSH